jgi:protein ImuA
MTLPGPRLETIETLKTRLRVESRKTQQLQSLGKRQLALGVAELDERLEGGLVFGALHEIAPTSPADRGAAAAFSLALCSLAQGPDRQLLWIQQDFAAQEGGELYAPGLAFYGLNMERVLLLRVAKPIDAFWAMEEALACKMLAATVMEIADDKEADLTPTRRLQLAAQKNGAMALLLRPRVNDAPSAAVTRWNVSSLLSTPSTLGGLGKSAFELRLTRNRQGACGQWRVAWNCHEHRFCSTDPLPFALAAVPRDRSTYTPARRAV